MVVSERDMETSLHVSLAWSDSLTWYDYCVFQRKTVHKFWTEKRPRLFVSLGGRRLPRYDISV